MDWIVTFASVYLRKHYDLEVLGRFVCPWIFKRREILITFLSHDLNVRTKKSLMFLNYIYICSNPRILCEFV